MQKILDFNLYSIDEKLMLSFLITMWILLFSMIVLGVYLTILKFASI